MGETILDDELTQKVCNNITAGLGIEKAALAAGCARRSIFNWLEKARADEEAGVEDSPYVRFAEALELARAKLAMRLLIPINRAIAKDSWQAAFRLGEALLPQDFLRKYRTELSGPDGEPLRITVEYSKRSIASDEDDQAEDS